jgi:Protein of unknown function (DUF1592)/Protein of unknown function (DUF1588)/Protein of unknown function (DUF1585)
MTHRTPCALLIIIVLAGGANAQTKASQASATDVSKVFKPLFDMYCTTCHNQTRKSGGLALDSLNTGNVAENTAEWEKMLQRLRARRDPPIGMARPDEARYETAISTVERALDHAYPDSKNLKSSNRVSNAELAVRMAKFIWNGAPDSTLQDAAKKGALGTAAEQQVRRMLQDPKANAIVTGFFEPWVLANPLDKVQNVDEDLRRALGTEMRLFFESQIHDDHNALDLWTANYTFINERLARHYGITGISGDEFRKFTFLDNTRGGILGQGSFLTATSATDRTSPVLRGKAILTTFFGIAPPPLLPNVPPLKPNDNRPMRARMQEHASNPVCSSCHLTFEPMGWALENFNRVGQWRNTDAGETIDASGSFIDGSKFNGPAELRAGLAKYKAAYYSNVTQKLLAYSLERPAKLWYLNDYEMPSVREILRDAAAHDYRWSTIVLGIVKSSPFQLKTGASSQGFEVAPAGAAR